MPHSVSWQQGYRCRRNSQSKHRLGRVGTTASTRCALKKPTYLAPLARDIATEKAKIYEGVWNAARSI